MRRVLLISPHFPPDTSAGSHRVRLLAPYLPEFGWEPTVVTVASAGYEGRLDLDLAQLVPQTLRVLRSPAWSARLTRRFGVGDLGLRAVIGLRHLCATVLDRERFDALFITIYPTYPALLGPWLKRRYRLPFVLDYQDPWVGSWGLEVGGGPTGKPDMKSRLSRALAGLMEPRVVRAADALTAVSARTFEDVLMRVRDARPRVCEAIPIGFDARDLDAVRRHARPNACFDERDGLVHVCYVGTLLPKGRDVLRAVLSAVARLRDEKPHIYRKLRLHFLGTSNERHPGAVARVLPVARDFGVADVINEHPTRLDYLDALNVHVRAHALILLGSAEPHYTPSKVFPALLSGRPVVAIYHSESSVLEVLARAGNRAHTITFNEQCPVGDRVAEIATALERLESTVTEHVSPTCDARLEPWSASALAGKLAGVFDAVAAC
jgi:glycosyltransferase involved in cell wall biosynthesis